MKKISIYLGAILLGMSSLHAQAVEKGNILITGYVGGPNLISSLFKTAIKSGSITDANGNPIDVTGLKAGGLLPVGGRVEYMLADRFGLGIDGSYANSSVSFNGSDGNGGTTNVKLSLPRPRVLLIGNFHFGKGKADFYVGGGIGYSSMKLNVSGSSTDPDVQSAIDEFKSTASKGLSIPVGLRAQFGTNIFFTDNVGLNLELGAGGALAKGGICVKI